jgi:hypothetical protein
MLRCLRVPFALWLGLSLGPAIAGAATPSPAIPRPGEYLQVEPATKKPLDGGSRLLIAAGKGGRLGFSIAAVRALDSSLGFVAGTLQGSLPLIWTQTATSGNCRLRFEAVPNGFRVTQDLGFGDCGFAGGVTANGIYLLVPETAPKG